MNPNTYCRLLTLLDKNRLKDVLNLVMSDKLNEDEKREVKNLNEEISSIILNLSDREKISCISTILESSWYSDPVYYRNAFHDVMKILLCEEYDIFIRKKFNEGLLK
jgi:hypothetical protein